jgi:A/G-specific adenine glycosylase
MTKRRASKPLADDPSAVPQTARALARRLLAWYDRHRRRMPWRALPGDSADPYHVWLSEIMLQQTTVAAVKSYFEAFLARWPTVTALAAAPLDDVLHAWQGLGYYARARNLHRAAKLVADELGGRFPDTEEGLRALPGVGAYTAAAVAAIAFGRDATPVDANVERVIARLCAIATPLPKAKAEIHERARRLTPADRPGDYVQALMDLGATLCSPKRPACALCPWSDACLARAQGTAESLPAKAPKAARGAKRGVVFWTLREDGAVLLRRRPESGILGGMIEVPSTEWREAAWPRAEALRAAPVRARWRALPGAVLHGFTHLDLELEILAARVAIDAVAAKDSFWWPLERLAEQALPTLTKKVVAHARGNVRAARMGPRVEG